MSARDELIALASEAWIGSFSKNAAMDEQFRAEAKVAIDAFAREVRTATLREIRNKAIEMDHNPDVDQYLWGYGANEICKMINALFKKARDGGD